MIEIIAAFIFAYCPINDWQCYDYINNCAIKSDGTATLKSIETCINKHRNKYEPKK